jgi:penicillin-binding protein 2
MVDMHRSIVLSSDVYYYALANDLGVDAIHDFMQPLGFGELTGIDIEGEIAGVLPSSEWNERRYHQKWYGGETISIGIGQGKNSFTLLQLARATAALANGGLMVQPHVVHGVEDAAGTLAPAPGQPSTAPVQLHFDPAHLAVVRAAMVGVTEEAEGTARAAFLGAPYHAAGKTGTAQVVGMGQNEKYDESRVEERHRDHSLFMAFAPAEPGATPRVALALLVENGGWGALAAAPIARQVFDYYLLGKLPPATVLAQQEPPAPGAAKAPVHAVR